MAYIYEKWHEFPRIVVYGESRVVLHLDEDFMEYVGPGDGGMRVKAELFVNRPDLFEGKSSETFRIKAQMSRSGFNGPGKIVGWVGLIKPVKNKWITKKQ